MQNRVNDCFDCNREGYALLSFNPFVKFFDFFGDQFVKWTAKYVPKFPVLREDLGYGKMRRDSLFYESFPDLVKLHILFLK